jgi:hypothetical protein
LFKDGGSILLFSIWLSTAEADRTSDDLGSHDQFLDANKVSQLDVVILDGMIKCIQSPAFWGLCFSSFPIRRGAICLPGLSASTTACCNQSTQLLLLVGIREGLIQTTSAGMLVSILVLISINTVTY